MNSLPAPVRRTIRRLEEVVPEPVGAKIRSLRQRRARRRWLPTTRISPTENLEYNSEIWDWYAQRWNDPAFRQQQLIHEGRADDSAEAVVRLGEEWGRLDDAVEVIEDWIVPHLDGAAVVGEIGTGGGRVAARVAPHVGEFHAFDISRRMLELVRVELAGHPHARFHHVPEPSLPTTLEGHFDFLYSFDVFVHLDLHVQWRYIVEVARALKPGGRGFLHTSNLTTTAGWERFVEQDRYRVEGFYFTTPQSVTTLLERAGLRVLAEKGGEQGNFYYERDYLVLFEKPPS